MLEEAQRNDGSWRLKRAQLGKFEFLSEFDKGIGIKKISLHEKIQKSLSLGNAKHSIT